MKKPSTLRINKESFVTIIQGDITQFYEVQKKIGEGAYGKIYKVKNKQSGDIRAMKQITKTKIQEEENKGKIIRVLNKWYSIMEQRIQNNEFKTIEEITKDFITLEERLNETFPNYIGKNELFNEFKTRVYAFASNYFSKKIENEKKIIEEENEQKIKALKDDLEMAKKNYNKEEEKNKIILEQNKTQINELQEELNEIKESLTITQKEKQIKIQNQKKMKKQKLIKLQKKKKLKIFKLHPKAKILK